MINFTVNDKANNSKSSLFIKDNIALLNKRDEEYYKKYNKEFKPKTFQSTIISLIGGNEFEAYGANTNLILPSEMNGFMDALHTCYSNHYPLTLSPDDIWLTLSQSFALHVEKNAETLRKQFVAHEGKVEINYQCDSFRMGSPNNDWMDGFNYFAKKIKSYIGNKHDLLTANFSTTGIIEKAASQIVLMDAMKQYFSYKCTTCCGIPEITLLGTTEDWKSIQTRVRNFAEFDGLADWAKTLDPILEEFVNTSSGNINKEFWNNIYKSESHGSGGPDVSGWANAFHLYLQQNGWVENPFIKNIKTKIHPSSIDYPSGVSKVPFIWDYYGSLHDYEFLAGFFGVSQDENLNVRPAIGWAVRSVK